MKAERTVTDVYSAYEERFAHAHAHAKLELMLMNGFADAKLLGGVEHEILHDQAAEVFGWLREGDSEYVPKELAAVMQAEVA